VHSGELARQRTRTFDESLLVDPEESDRPVVGFLGSSPGRMALVAVVLIAALLAVGVAASTMVSDRQSRLETLRSHTDPLADAAQRIYGALSFANTTAAAAFLSGGVEPHDVRDGYDAAIGQASAGLVTASNGVSPNDIRSLTLLTDLSNRLALYTGIVATARANNRAGRPIGVAYLSESSTLMQQDILPSAERLYQTQSDAVIASGRSAGTSRVVIAAAVLVLFMLLLAQGAGSAQSSPAQPRSGGGVGVDGSARGMANRGRPGVDARRHRCPDGGRRAAEHGGDRADPRPAGPCGRNPSGCSNGVPTPCPTSNSTSGPHSWGGCSTSIRLTGRQTR